MGKTKRKHPDIEEILARPWCYYCERDFDDLKILINHQKAKHFKCERCGRRLNTAGGLSVHMTQVHKETLTIIENALPNRAGLDVEIFGMEGIPDDVVQSHQQRVLQQFAQAEADRRAATGNTGPGGSAGGAIKKPKFESPSDLKKRLAEHKAKKAVEEAAGISSGGNTPGGMGNQSPGMGQSPGNYAGSPGYPQQQIPFGGLQPQNQPFQSYPPSYGQQSPPFQPPQSPFSPQQPGFNPSGIPQNQGFAPPQQFQQQQPGGPNFQPQFQSGHPLFQGGPPPQFQNGPPPQFQNGPPPQFQNGPPPQFQNGPPPNFQGGPAQFQSRPYSGSPPPPYPQGQFQPPQNHGPPQQNGMPAQRLAPAPGLPQRPSFGAPPVNAFQMQQMHQGQLSGPPNPTDHSYNIHKIPQSQSQNGGPGGLPLPVSAPGSSTTSANATSLDDLLSGAAKDAEKASETKPDMPKVEEPMEEKKGKKEKDKNMKLIYSDNEVSPEEKMAQMPRYAFAPSGL